MCRKKESEQEQKNQKPRPRLSERARARARQPREENERSSMKPTNDQMRETTAGSEIARMQSEEREESNLEERNRPREPRLMC